MIRVLFIDDDARLRDCWARVFASHADIQLLGTLERADDLTRVVGVDRPDVVILDLTMPGRDPVDACRELAQLFPAVKVIIYSGLDDRTLLDAAYDAGAWGFVDKLSPPDTILGVIRSVAGNSPESDPIRKHATSAARQVSGR